MTVRGALAPALAAVLAVAACGAGDPSPGEPARACPAVAAEPGSRVLFDGTEATAEAWRMAGPGRFDLVDCELRSVGGLGLLWHEDAFTDYALRVDWKVAGDDNSGVFVGFPDPGDDPWVAVQQGHEIQIDATDEAGWTTGAVYSFQAPEVAARDGALRPPGEWNTFDITVVGDRVTVDLNGIRVNDYVDTDPARMNAPSHVGLQNHGEGDDVSFGAIVVREL